MTRGAKPLAVSSLRDESLRGLGITAFLDKYFQYEAILINSTPQPMFAPIDRDDNFIQVPYVDGPLLARTL